MLTAQDTSGLNKTTKQPLASSSASWNSKQILSFALPYNAELFWQKYYLSP